MNVALDATPLSISTGGITRYTAELSCALAAEFPGDIVHLLSDQSFSLPARAPANLRKGRRPKGVLGRRWWSLGIAVELLRLRAEIFHGTDFGAPYLPIRPAVMTLHDLAPWRDPSWHDGAARVRRRSPALMGLGLATMVITPTCSIRREAIARFGLPPGRVVAVPLAASALFVPKPGPPPPRPYFLYTGVLEPRKNLPLLVDCWRELRRHHDVDLVLAGRRRDGFEAPAGEPGLTLLGEVPDTDLPALYSGAAAVVYPSLYEGFGLPVVEAMSCGAPVITTTDPALSEVSAGAAICLDPADPGPWIDAMRAMLVNVELRNDLRARSLARSREFSWAQTARLTHAVYLEAKERFGR